MVLVHAKVSSEKPSSEKEQLQLIELAETVIFSFFSLYHNGKKMSFIDVNQKGQGFLIT